MKSKIIDYIKNNKYIVISNLIIFICQFIIISHVGRHGWDDYYASTYYNAPYMTFTEKVNQVNDRMQNWNCRLGEFIYFWIGAFPSVVFWIVNAMIIVTLSNLIVYYAVGKEKYSKKSSTVAFLNLLTYVFFITIYPGITDSFLWMGSVCNHAFSIMLLLFALLPFKNNSYKDEKKSKFSFKYILYLAFCFVCAFGSEGAIISVMVAMLIYNILIFVRKKKINIFYLLPFLVMCIGFIIFLKHNPNRVNGYLDLESTILAINLFNVYFWKCRIAIFSVFAVFSIIYIFKYKFTKELMEKYIWILISFVAVIAILIFAYYSERAIIIFSISINISIIFIIHTFLEQIKKNKLIILSFILLVFLIFLALNYCHSADDYNEYQAIRKEYIINQLENDVIYVPLYDYRVTNKLVYNYDKTVVKRFDDEDAEWEEGIRRMYQIPDSAQVVLVTDIDKGRNLYKN